MSVDVETHQIDAEMLAWGIATLARQSYLGPEGWCTLILRDLAAPLRKDVVETAQIHEIQGKLEPRESDLHD